MILEAKEIIPLQHTFLGYRVKQWVSNTRMLVWTFFSLITHFPVILYYFDIYSVDTTCCNTSGQDYFCKLHRHSVVIPKEKKKKKGRKWVNFENFLQLNLLMSPYCLPQLLPCPKPHKDRGLIVFVSLGVFQEFLCFYCCHIGCLDCCTRSTCLHLTLWFILVD